MGAWVLAFSFLSKASKPFGGDGGRQKVLGVMLDWGYGFVRPYPDSSNPGGVPPWLVLFQPAPAITATSNGERSCFRQDRTDKGRRFAGVPARRCELQKSVDTTRLPPLPRRLVLRWKKKPNPLRFVAQGETVLGAGSWRQSQETSAGPRTRVSADGRRFGSRKPPSIVTGGVVVPISALSCRGRQGRQRPGHLCLGQGGKYPSGSKAIRRSGLGVVNHLTPRRATRFNVSSTRSGIHEARVLVVV